MKARVQCYVAIMHHFEGGWGFVALAPAAIARLLPSPWVFCPQKATVSGCFSCSGQKSIKDGRA